MDKRGRIVRCYIAVVSSCREVFGSVQLTNATQMVFSSRDEESTIETRKLKTIERKLDEVKSV